MAPQTPQQRRANAKFARKEESKMGTYRPPKADAETRRKQDIKEQFGNSPIPKWMIYLLIFMLVGGIGLELLRLFF